MNSGRMKSRVITTIIIISSIGLMLSIKDAAAVTLGFNPATQNAVMGTQVDVALTISGLGDFSPDSLSEFDLDISFDAAVLGFSGVTYGDPVLGDQLDLFGFGGIITTTPVVGSVNLFELSFDLGSDLDALQAGSFTLATLTFDTLGVGTSALDISVNTLSDAFADPLGVNSLGSGSVVVAAVPVPEPSLFLLLGTGLLGWVVAGKRRKTLGFLAGSS